MGVGEESIVRTPQELRQRVRWVLDTYHQPALVEEFMTGREFTVGYIGNRGSAENRTRPQLYNGDGYHIFPVLEIDTSDIATEGVYGLEAKSIDIRADDAPGYLCPADIPVALHDRLCDLTIRAAEAIGASDVSRVDFRLDDDNVPHLLEINTLPGLNREQSDLCIMAAAEGMAYETLINEILYLAAERHGIQVPQEMIG
jgi:D-alanine-D-alanine ligase